jgi:hypothetical protein
VEATIDLVRCWYFGAILSVGLTMDTILVGRREAVISQRLWRHAVILVGLTE